MVRGLRILLSGLFISSSVFMSSLSHAAFATSEFTAVHSGTTLLVNATDADRHFLSPGAVRHKQPMKHRDPDDLGM
jgi:hypothetical protein